ncbi:zinc finger protein VAR3, chloroplastic [Cornus florida]|uniref:zinc finger protein VAR3, chloroplastic n=1 Tax=Cornus florida TaxID=4283 RepID=UPI0028A189AE|nr:zinc finger protein VAR3, chloroplastic [Cornus florida]XP_059668193.1 zinc finger protein VAR3, chloroplastic [Cornus florida]
MAGASRFVMLLTTPFPLHLRPSLLRIARHSRHFRLSSLSVTPHHLPHSPTTTCRTNSVFLLRASQKEIHTQTSHFGDSLDFSSPNSPASHPWPEWSKLVDNLYACRYQGHGIGAEEDAFVAYENLSNHFVHAASACLAFARHRSDLVRSLSRRDIEVVVEKGTPFLFKNALDTARRMRPFMDRSRSNVLEFEEIHMVDLMKYLLSYASNPSVSSENNNLYNGKLVESSVRNLLIQLAEVSSNIPELKTSFSMEYQLPDRYGQTPRPLGQKIEMKRGDWICPRCSFMNFARNIKCLECEEARPKRQLTGGEWECPQCDFFNYGRNLVCLRCDCKRPGEASFGTRNSRPGLGYSNGDYANKGDVDSRLADNEEKAQRWFSKVSQPDNASDLSKVAADEDFPEIMPLRKGVNRFVVSTRKTSLERRLADSQYKRNLGDGGSSTGNHIQTRDANKTFNRSLDEIQTVRQNAETENSSFPRLSSASLRNGHSKESSSSYVPFVPLPADTFAEKSQNSRTDNEKGDTENPESLSLKATREQTGHVSGNSESAGSGDGLHSSEMPASQAENQDKEKDQAGKSERWFKRVAELHDVTDLASEISDEDFPEIMPMRKGENRFVVSKKKDRSLTSPMYKRRMAMEQAGNTNFVPFVPFPPDYFAKKDKEQRTEADETVFKATGESSSISTKPEKLPENLDNVKIGVSDTKQVENKQTSLGRWTSESYVGSSNERETGAAYRTQISENPIQNSSSNFQTNSKDSWSTGYSGKDNRTEGTNMAGSLPRPTENQNVRSSWTGKSLEGSAVKEPDPLDMSEEAKAQRWFRRVAQIKDISELSQIPDEDFPSIMPMRKGVNRFVVSKRKTPLERRLTSPQYKRNLPIISSNSPEKENDKN